MTKEFYNKNSKEYIKSTIDVNMEEQYKPFETELKEKAKVLDIGFGSGRDTKYFNSKYIVTSIDNSEAFVNNAKEVLDSKVMLLDVLDINFKNEFDGIWACASLLHLKKDDLKETFNKCYIALKDKGVMYTSFKEGTFEGIKEGRYYTYLTAESLAFIIKDTGFSIKTIFYTIDNRAGRQDQWLNVYLIKG